MNSGCAKLEMGGGALYKEYPVSGQISLQNSGRATGKIKIGINHCWSAGSQTTIEIVLMSRVHKTAHKISPSFCYGSMFPLRYFPKGTIFLCSTGYFVKIAKITIA